MDILDYNRRAWDREVERGNKWTVPVTSEEIAAARSGQWQILLTPITPVPRAWFPAELTGVRVLCLASGGGQQAPILAAAGAEVTVFDNSPAQLAQDRLVAERDALSLATLQGDMADLSALADQSFDLIFHPVSNLFVPDVRPVWRECHRVLRPGGALLAGFCSPAQFIFADPFVSDPGELRVQHKLPFSDLTDLDEATRQRYVDREEPLMFGHTLTDQLGGQLAAGLTITDLYEDGNPGQALAAYMPTFVATRALRPARA